MKLPEVKNGEKYVGLYIVDFGESTSVGFTAEEVGELLESKKFGGIKVYKIYNAYPDGRMELRGVVNETFQLEIPKVLQLHHPYQLKYIHLEWKHLQRILRKLLPE